MAIYTPRQPFEFFSGRLGVAVDGVAMPTNGRNLLRSYVVPTNTITSQKTTAQDILSQLAFAYTFVPSGLAAGWRDLGAELVRIGRLRSRYSLLGQQAFIACNWWRYAKFLSIENTPPNLVELPTPQLVQAYYLNDTDTPRVDFYVPPEFGDVYTSVRISPAVESTSRLARANELRCAAAGFADCLTAETSGSLSLEFPGSLVPWEVGWFAGVELQTWSLGFIPGPKVFIRQAEILGI